jgi:hypothetical protein
VLQAVQDHASHRQLRVDFRRGTLQQAVPHPAGPVPGRLRRWIVLLTLGQLVLFHLQSLAQIHWFYPLLMSAILSWFPLMRYLTPANVPPTRGQKHAGVKR